MYWQSCRCWFCSGLCCRQIHLGSALFMLVSPVFTHFGTFNKISLWLIKKKHLLLCVQFLLGLLPTTFGVKININKGPKNHNMINQEWRTWYPLKGMPWRIHFVAQWTNAEYTFAYNIKYLHETYHWSILFKTIRYNAFTSQSPKKLFDMYQTKIINWPTWPKFSTMNNLMTRVTSFACPRNSALLFSFLSFCFSNC